MLLGLSNRAPNHSHGESRTAHPELGPVMRLGRPNSNPLYSGSDLSWVRVKGEKETTGGRNRFWLSG